jgi:cell division septation protein DedD
MDKMIPLAQRKKGVAIALAKAKAKPAPKAEPAKPVPRRSAPVGAAANPATPTSGGWRIQLGAFSQRSSAEALFRKLAGTGPLAGRHPFLIPVGAMTRLQAGPFESRAAAAAACATLSSRGQACFPVPAK